jgi:hypothetical protein
MFPRDIQLAICARLKESSYFSASPPIPVIPRCKANLSQAIAEAAASLGVCVLVFPGKGKFERHEEPMPGLRGTFIIRVLENTQVNRNTAAGGTGQPAEDIAWAAAQLLKHWTPLHPVSREPLTGNAFVLGEWDNNEDRDDSGAVHTLSEFSVSCIGGDSAGPYGANLMRVPPE